jgi:hypothetical protein
VCAGPSFSGPSLERRRCPTTTSTIQISRALIIAIDHPSTDLHRLSPLSHIRKQCGNPHSSRSTIPVNSPPSIDLPACCPLIRRQRTVPGRFSNVIIRFVVKSLGKSSHTRPLSLATFFTTYSTWWIIHTLSGTLLNGGSRYIVQHGKERRSSARSRSAFSGR